ncbi:2-amino-3,7-dideoxy-D-threo-hept-6-ulosonate synthase [Desulfoplanes formicivorans]|uniref:Fructose-bisphosphate aldolase n=1 Tax=Desulfoplanes formicivorans TaxID=1592317 RepID=A0A194AFJ7_9BACT|nr:2-amino-3,7-dideoxy-D-threo-hept-6-ulosonate synthase [Desulfoplanes formicivorans]GAU08847.1 fructose-bisphosphate aldolase [Desulfoplanes formicivorans]
MNACSRRCQRLFDRHSRTSILLPLDHGVSEGMIQGLEDMSSLLKGLDPHLVQGVILHKGLAAALIQDIDPRINLIIHLSAGTRHAIPPYAKSLVCSVQEAVRLGADAVSIHVNMGNDCEDRMLTDMGMVTDEAHLLGIPVLAMIYARGGQIVNELDPTLVAHSIRLGAEMGADLVKVPYSGDPQSFSKAVRACPVPVLVAGGPKKTNTKAFLDMVAEAMECGARGVSIGRNIFQHRNPAKALKELDAVLRR